jgi:ferrous iron transport protein A
VQLDNLPCKVRGKILSINWSLLGETEGRRLRDLGFDAGIEVEMLHRGWFLFRDPIAVQIGRMTVAIRTVHAAAIAVEAL